MVKINIDLNTLDGLDQMQALLDVRRRQITAWLGEPTEPEPRSMLADLGPVAAPPVSAGPSEVDPGADPAEPLAEPEGSAQAGDMGMPISEPAPRKQRARPERTYVEPEDWAPLIARVVAGETAKQVAADVGVDARRLHGKVLAAKRHGGATATSKDTAEPSAELMRALIAPAPKANVAPTSDGWSAQQDRDLMVGRVSGKSDGRIAAIVGKKPPEVRARYQFLTAEFGSERAAIEALTAAVRAAEAA